MVDVAVGRHIRCAAERRVMDALCLDVVWEAQRELHVIAQSVVGRDLIVGDAEANFVEMRRNRFRRALRRDVRTFGYVRRVERTVRGVEREAPCSWRHDRFLPCSAGEVGIRSGRSGVSRGEKSESDQRCDGESPHQPRSALAIAASTSSHIPPVTAVTKFPFASYTRMYGNASAWKSRVACFAAALSHLPMLTR